MTQRIKEKQPLPRRASACALGAEPLLPGASYVSVLLPEEAPLKRQDYCLSCWQHHKKALEKQPAITYWRGVVPAPTAKAEKHRPDEQALALFCESEEKLESEEKAMRYLLSLYLVRTRQLVRVAAMRGCEKTTDRYEILASGEVVTVERVTLTPVAAEALQKELQRRLGLGEATAPAAAVVELGSSCLAANRNEDELKPFPS